MRNLLLLIFFSVMAALPAQKNHNFEVSKNLEIFNAVYKTLDLYYVDTLQANKQIVDAINYLLDGLDPYTEYYPEQDTRDLETMTTGKYAGIGALIRYSSVKKRCVINEPYEGQPAAKAGVMSGDVILSIDGEPVKVKGDEPVNDYTSSVSNRLRGDPDTEIILVVDRPGEGERTFRFKREAIQLPAIPYYGMVTDSIGYIFLNTFTRDCYQDVEQALKELKGKGAQSLILDLRNNGGGLAIEAVRIVNLFVPKDKLILKMKGKTPSANSSYYTTRRESLDLKIPLVVLVNATSASSSEITCGALQDLDRAVVMGERTYGKGLVQQPRELPYGGLLKLTTSHYYIPSGRCIQALDYSHRGQNGEVYRTPDSLTHVFKTANGREVRDGGGITPDITVETDSLPNLISYLRVSEQLLDYLTAYRIAHPTIGPAATFSISDEDYEIFKDSIIKSGFTYDRQTYKALQELKKIARFEGYDKTASAEIEALEKKLQHNLAGDLDTWKKPIKELLNAELCLRYYYNKGMMENSMRSDRVLHQAIQLLRHPNEYNRLLKP